MGLREDLNRYTPRKEQDEALEFVKKIHANKPDNKFYLMNLPVGTGKAQPLYSKILTPYGWKELRDLNEGDYITLPKGGISKIIKLHDIQILPTYKITFADGRTTECTENHLWKVWHGDYRNKWKVLPLKDVIKKIS